MGVNRLTGPLRLGPVSPWPIRGGLLVRGGQIMRQLPKKGGVEVNTAKAESHIRPRTLPSSTVRIRGRSGRGLVTTGPRNYVPTEEGITD